MFKRWFWLLWVIFSVYEVTLYSGKLRLEMPFLIVLLGWAFHELSTRAKKIPHGGYFIAVAAVSLLIPTTGVYFASEAARKMGDQSLNLWLYVISVNLLFSEINLPPANEKRNADQPLGVQ